MHRLARRGKYLLADLSSGETLVMHLGMSGAFRVHDADAAPEPHDHVVFALESGVQVSFNDPRRFGIMDLVPSTDLDRRPPLDAMGPEPLSAEFNAAALARACARRRTPIKVALLDQEVVAGLGNIYASEALEPGAPLAATAGLEPRDPGGPAAQERACPGGRDQGRAAPGDRPADWPPLSRGAFRVYDREATLPRGCPGIIRRITQAGRSTYYCPKCQRSGGQKRLKSGLKGA